MHIQEILPNLRCVTFALFKDTSLGQSAQSIQVCCIAMPSVEATRFLLSNLNKLYYVKQLIKGV